MKPTHPLIVMSLIFAAASLHAQPGVLWTRTYGGTSLDCGQAVQQTSDGGFVVAGYTYSSGSGYSDVYLIRTDAQGDTLWNHTYGGSSYDKGYGIQQTSDGGFVVVGWTESFGAGGSDIWLLCTDAQGDTLWTRTYGGSVMDIGHSVQQTSDGGFVVAGYTYSFGAGGYDVWLIHTDAQGNILWTRTYGGSSSDYGYSVQQASDGGFVVAGCTGSFGAGYSDIWLIRTDAQGDTLWTRPYGGSGDDYGYSVQQTADSGFVLAGETRSFGAGLNDVYLIRTDAQGDTLWTRTYGGGGSDFGYSVQQTAGGGFVVAGNTRSFGAGGADLWLIQTDVKGDTLWTRTYGGTSSDYGQSIQKTTDSGFVVAGWISPFGAGNEDVWLIRLGPESPAAVESESKEIPTAFALEQNYPNPFNPATTIRFDLPEAAEVQLVVYDLQGREVARLVDERREAGYHQVVWDGRAATGREVPSGIYIARLTTPTYAKSIKLVLLR